MKKSLLTLLALSASLCFSCGNDDLPDDHPLTNYSEKLVLFINEGNFLAGNASISVYDRELGGQLDNAFEEINNRLLGDVAFSATSIDDHIYLVVNNSGKIEVLDPTSLESTSTISGLGSPRFVMETEENDLLVSDLFANAITVLNKEDGTVKSTIDMPGWTEQFSGKSNPLVLLPNSPYIYRINSETNAIADSVFAGANVYAMETDQSGTAWIARSEVPYDMTSMQLVGIDQDATEIAHSIDFTGGGGFHLKTAMASDGHTLYVLANNLYRFDTENPTLAPEIIVEAEGRNFYGLGIDPDNGDIYLSDALDYVQNSPIYRFDSQATAIDTLSGGVATGSFYFYTN
ncbi:DUF5074 domain-containing protein [Chitinophagales bacterium]|nr:DUF5074 domain-containing protein [Chitinophagales bacterium]